MKPKICILGCGWFGLPLAKKLIQLGYDINGSTTSKAKITTLKTAKIHPFLIQFSSEGIQGNINACLHDCNILIVNIPPGLRKNPESNYLQKMKDLVNAVENTAIEQVLFIGSTSVYDDDSSFPVITEKSPTSTSKTALHLLDVETLFQTNLNFKTTVLRFSGLFAEDRHPAHFLSGKTNLKNGDAPVNLIHRDDCIDISIALIKHHIWDTIINGATPTHPTKAAYYTSMCKTLKLAPPEFNNTVISKGKIIDSTKLVQLLNYDFKVKL